MKYLLQFCRILLIAFVSEVCHWLIPLPVPASIYGIVILFALLATGILPLEKVRETGKFLVEIMPVMFIPAAVGLMDSWGMISSSLVSYAVVTAVSTVLVMGAAGLVTQAVIRGGKKHPKKEEEVQA